MPAILLLLQEAVQGAAEAAQAVPEPETPLLLQPNVGLVVWTTVAFGIVFFLLAKYAWGPIARAMEERETHIDASLKQAEAALAEAKKIQADNVRARREAEGDAQRILREAREAAERLRTEEVEKTRTQIRGMQEAAQAEIEREKESALAELRAEVADLALAAASKVLDENLNDARQRRLVENFINELPKN